MNFLAHALLAARHPSSDDGLVAGGVAGDWIRGPLGTLDLPADLKRGAALHRAIDVFAETHPAFRASRARCAPERRRWSGVLVDMYYDHLLAADFGRWHDRPLAEFSRDTYRMLVRHLDACPPAARPGLELMIREDWLGLYATTDGLAEILGRMSRRARQPNPLASGTVDLLADLASFGDDCTEFMDDAIEFVVAWRSPEEPGRP